MWSSGYIEISTPPTPNPTQIIYRRLFKEWIIPVVLQIVLGNRKQAHTVLHLFSKVICPFFQNQTWCKKEQLLFSLTNVCVKILNKLQIHRPSTCNFKIQLPLNTKLFGSWQYNLTGPILGVKAWFDLISGYLKSLLI